MDETERTVLSTFKRLVAQRVGLRQMILFGSRARGDADAESDMDVLVIVDDGTTASGRDLVSECAWQAGFDHGIVVVPITFTQTEWEDGLDRHAALGRAIAADGIPV